MARYGREYGEPGWVETFRRGWGYGVGNGYDNPYAWAHGGRSRFGSGYGGSERGEGWGRGYDRGFPPRGGSTARGGRGGYGSLYGTGNRTGYNRFPRGYMGRSRYDREG